MKEKTFKELILSQKDEHASVTVTKCLELMRQVREATIAECHLIADKYYFQNSQNIIIDINNLPTDRITITDND